MRFKYASDILYDENHWFKSIVRANAVTTIDNPHYMNVKEKNYINTSHERIPFDVYHNTYRTDKIDDNIMLYHYILKSKEEFNNKIFAVVSMHHKKIRAQGYNENDFNNRDKNISKVFLMNYMNMKQN